VLTGGDKADFTEPTSEDDGLALERAEFMRLVKTPAPSRGSSTCSKPASPFEIN
jgi:hypothetical protein